MNADSSPIFNVAQLLKEPLGATRSASIAVPLSELVPELLAAIEQRQPDPALEGTVRLMHTTDGVLVQGNLDAELTVPCSRCLEPVIVPLEVEVEENFASTIDLITGKVVKPDEPDQALWIDEHHILDLTEVLRQDVLVAVPLHELCRDDCRGLCPTCGKNLNEGPCDCEPETDPRWSRLVELLNDAAGDNEDSSEKE